MDRLLLAKIQLALSRHKSVLLLGPRQTGKTTLIKTLPAQRYINLAKPKERLRYERSLTTFTDEIVALAETHQQQKPLIIIDEVQKIPLLLDAVQDLIDEKIAQFILTGSSARKLRRQHEVNLLPGRVIPLRLDSLVYQELPTYAKQLEILLVDGMLPEIVLQKDILLREQLLDAYVNIYLEEEVRAEALVRKLGDFANFLELAAAESGKIVNFSKLSQEIGVSHKTISAYYQILEDCLIAERIEPLINSKTRLKLSRAPKYLFYDLGVRRIAAREGRQPAREQLGYLFEQYVGLELIHMIRLNQQQSTVKYWRDPAGPVVDWIVEKDTQLIPIEVKWTETPTQVDAKYLKIFLKEYRNTDKAYIVCRTPHRMKISEQIYAISWKELASIFL